MSKITKSKDIRISKKCKWCNKKLSGRHHFLCDKCWIKNKKIIQNKELKKLGWKK